LKVTVPLASAPVEELTWALKLTTVPMGEGFNDEVTIVVVGALLVVNFSAEEVLAAKMASPT
jgi:hypothetical protein